MKIAQRIALAAKTLFCKGWHAQLERYANEQIERYHRETWDATLNELREFVWQKNVDRMKSGIGDPECAVSVYVTELRPSRDEFMGFSPVQHRHVPHPVIGVMRLVRGSGGTEESVKREIAHALAQELIARNLIAWYPELDQSTGDIVMNAKVNIFTRQ